MMASLWIWRQSMMEVGNESEVFSNPDGVTGHSSKETKFYTSADILTSK